MIQKCCKCGALYGLRFYGNLKSPCGSWDLYICYECEEKTLQRNQPEVTSEVDWQKLRWAN